MDTKQYDVVIIGAGVAGSAMAHALATLPRSTPWSIALVERSFSEPDRFAGEILQPGGLEALRELGMESALDGTGAVLLEGYDLVHGNQSGAIPFPKGKEGRNFHHGRFVMGLRHIALQNINVHPIKATATQLIECQITGRVTGVTVVSPEGEGKLDVFGDLVIVADGGFSKFRQSVLQEAFSSPEVCSYSLGGIMKDATPATPRRAMLILPDGLGPVYVFPLTDTETRIIIDLPAPLPKGLQDHIVDTVVPRLPEFIREPAIKAFTDGRLRKMPNSYLPPIRQATSSSKKGIFLLGDSWNTRHPVTGAGMTIALKDVVCLRTAIESAGMASFTEWDEVSAVLRQWQSARKSHGPATLNMMGSCTYALLKWDHGVYGTLRRVIMKYFVSETVPELQKVAELLAGLKPSPIAMFKHHWSIGLYLGRLLLTQPRQIRECCSTPEPLDKAAHQHLSLVEYSKIVAEALVIVWTAVTLVFPIIWNEMK